jgi:P-type E1-E2 ATPase
LLNNLYAKIEKDLNFAGVSAIEDKLQDGVPETIEMLINSNIRVWVLTGDKKVIVFNIGNSIEHW